MKKILLILLCFPMIGFGHDLKIFCKHDIIINQILENTISIIKKKHTPKVEFRFYLNQKASSIDWNKKRFSQWQIIEKKID